MGIRQFAWQACLPLVAAGLLGGTESLVYGQFGAAPAGVVVDAEGLLRKQEYPDPSGQLTQQRLAAAKAALAPELAQKSPLRKVSLNRLEKALEAQLAQGLKPTDEMRYLAGLTSVEYVFLYPDTGDVVLAGPSEGWMVDLSGRVVGMDSGQPIVELQDLAAALRAFAPQRNSGTVIGCSIDPTQQGLAKMQEFLRNLGGRAIPNQTQYIVDGLRTSLGLQEVRVMGVAPDTHFAQVMVEADYRMKLIGIGLEDPPVKITTFIQKADASIARNALIRWYFIPNYECVCLSEDKLAMQLVGEGVKLVGENEMVQAGGGRQVTGGTNRASQAFCTSFTQNYPQLAHRVPVYGQLRNLIDLAIVAAFLQKHDYYAQAHWAAATLLDEDQYTIQTYQSPVKVDTVVTSLWKGNRLLTPVAGGVSIQASSALASENLIADKDGKVTRVRNETGLNELPAGKWWWD